MNLELLLPAARGEVPADLVLKGGWLVNVFSGQVEEADLAISRGVILGVGSYQGREEIDVSGRYLTPGLIDPHLHLESSMVAPDELARALVPRGTTALVADPHEVANVLGLAGIDLLIGLSRRLPLDIYFMAPACVPATSLETAGAELSARDLGELLGRPEVLGLAEVMNFPGVIYGHQGILEKLALFQGRPIDGHAPLLKGRELCAYILPGITTDHESALLEEAREKLARGMRIFIREGSQAKNLAGLLPAVNNQTWPRTSFCTDDRHPEDLLSEGHLDHVLRRAVDLGLDPVRAVAMVTINPAAAYGLSRRGALAPGYTADVAVFDSLDSFRAEMVFKAGRLTARNGELVVPLEATAIPDWAGPMNVAALDAAALTTPVAGPRVRVIQVQEGQLLTGHQIVTTPESKGLLAADPQRDLAHLAVIERHHKTGRIGLGLVNGFGLQRGALASSVAHDSHNIVAVGMSNVELLTAIEAVRDMRGGLAVAVGETIVARLPLPFAGLMSDRSLEETAAGIKKLNQAAKESGCSLNAPFMALSFLALPVIPSLKLTDRGLVDVDSFSFTSLFAP